MFQARAILDSIQSSGLLPTSWYYLQDLEYVERLYAVANTWVLLTFGKLMADARAIYTSFSEQLRLVTRLHLAAFTHLHYF